MSKLDDLIRERGCDDLTAIQWCKEKLAICSFSPNEVTIEVADGNRQDAYDVYAGSSLSAAVLACVRKTP